MNFDFEYVTTVAESTGGGNNFDWRIIFIIVGGIVLIALVTAAILLLKSKSKDKIDVVVGEGTVFCSKCYNEFDSGLAKCPYCKNKKM